MLRKNVKQINVQNCVISVVVGEGGCVLRNVRVRNVVMKILRNILWNSGWQWIDFIGLWLSYGRKNSEIIVEFIMMMFQNFDFVRYMNMMIVVVSIGSLIFYLLCVWISVSMLSSVIMIISMILNGLVVVCSIVQNVVKYQIGVILGGVCSGFVGMKLFVLRKQLFIFGEKNMISVNIIRNMYMLRKLWIEQYGWNGMLLSGMLFLFFFVLILMLLGLFDFILCSVIRWVMMRLISISGIVIMWNVKKWFSVMLDMMQLL